MRADGAHTLPTFMTKKRGFKSDWLRAVLVCWNPPAVYDHGKSRLGFGRQTEEVENAYELPSFCCCHYSNVFSTSAENSGAINHLVPTDFGGSPDSAIPDIVDEHVPYSTICQISSEDL